MPDDYDWRLQGVVEERLVFDGSNQPSDVVTVLVDKIKLDSLRILAFPIPNATAMLLNAARRSFNQAQDLINHEALRIAPRGFVQFQSNADAIDYSENMTISVFAAYTSLECFANEFIPPWVTYPKEGKKGEPSKTLNKEDIERSLKLGEKLAVILPELFRVATPRGNAVWDNYVKLEKLRNRLVHMKDADRDSGDVSKDTIWKALIAIPSPFEIAKKLIDHFLCSVEFEPGSVYKDCRPVRPRWHVELPPQATRE